jgi:glycosyltransferase involved in cell wall biosynthesis
MLVRNPGTHDTRVRKEAVSLARVGHRVRVICSTAPDLPAREWVDGVLYERAEVRALTREARRERYLADQRTLRDAYAARRRALVERQRRHAGRLATRRAQLVARRNERAAAARGAIAKLAEDHRRSSAASTAERNRQLDELGRLAVVGPERATRAAAIIEDAKRQAEIERAVFDRDLAVARSRLEREVQRSKQRFVRRLALLARAGNVAQRRTALGLRLARRRYLARRRARQRRWRVQLRLAAVAVPLAGHRDYHRSIVPLLEMSPPDVVHAHDLNTLYGAWRYARRYGCELVYDSHELELHRNTTWTVSRRLVDRIIELLAIRRASAVITVSTDIAVDLADTYRIPRPTVLLNSPPLSTSRVGATSMKAMAGLEESQRMVMYVGKVTEGRGLEVLVDALAHLPDDCHLGVLGPRSQPHDAELMARAAARGHADRLQLLRPLSAPDVPPALATADAFVISAPNICRSYDLSLPNKLFDAVMAGVPIAVGQLSTMRRFVLENELGCDFNERSPRDIAAAILFLFDETPAGIRDRQRLRALQQLVCWERQAQELTGLYERLPVARSL